MLSLLYGPTLRATISLSFSLLPFSKTYTSWDLSTRLPSKLRTFDFVNMDSILCLVHSSLCSWSIPVIATLFALVDATFSSVQSLSCVRLFATPWIAACWASLSITISRNSLRLVFIESVMPSSHLIFWRPLLLWPPILPSIRVFSNESTLPWGGQSTGVSALASFLPKKS